MPQECKLDTVFLYFQWVCICRKGKCKQVEQGQECWLGMRLRQYHMLCGALLRVWKRVADVVSDVTNSSIFTEDLTQRGTPPNFLNSFIIKWLRCIQSGLV